MDETARELLSRWIAKAEGQTAVQDANVIRQMLRQIISNRLGEPLP